MRFLCNLTAAEVKSSLSYDPETGVFTRLVGRGAKVVGTPTDSGHLLIWVCGRLYKAHRLAWLVMTGVWPECEIDHINRNPADNRWVNLREATRADNVRNRTNFARKHNLPRGVTINRGRYRAQAKIDGVQTYLGYFDAPEQAHEAYLAAIGPARAAFLPDTQGETR